MVAHDRDADRQAARERLRRQRQVAVAAAELERSAPLAVYYRKASNLPMLPAGPARCPADCPWCPARRWTA